MMAPAEVPGTRPAAAEFWQSPAEGVAWGSLRQLECNQTAGVSWTILKPRLGLLSGWTCRRVFFVALVIPAIRVTV